MDGVRPGLVGCRLRGHRPLGLGAGDGCSLGALDYAGAWSSRSCRAPRLWRWHWFWDPHRLQGRRHAPHNLPFVLLGVGLLWFGWFGFNAGSALAANGMASAIFLNTLVAGCLGMLGWLSVERVRDGRPTTFGAASGVVAGLVAITPSCGTVNTLGAAIVGLAAGIVCSFAIGLKFRWLRRLAGRRGRAFRGRRRRCAADRVSGRRGHDGWTRRVVPTVAASHCSANRHWPWWRSPPTRSGCRLHSPSFIDRVMGFRLSPEDETAGVDFTQHAETAYAEGVHGHQMSHRPLFDATQRRRCPSDRGVPLKQRLRGSL